MLISTLLVLTGAAHATNICGITSTEISDVETYYSFGLTTSEYEDFVDSPFDCSMYGDLCDDLGTSNAEDLVCTLWGMAKDEDTEADIHTIVTTDMELSAEPNLVGGTWDSSNGSCAGATKQEERENTQGTRKVRVKAYYTELIFYKEIGGRTKGFHRDGGTGPWTKDHNGLVTNSTQYSSTGSTNNTCDTGSPYTPDGYGADDDGAVKSHKWSSRSLAPEHVEATGTYAGLTACAVNTASWNDGNCL